MISCATTDVAGTQAVAAEVAALVVDGDLLVLVGDLGAGKTHFTQGFARAVGVDEPVTSPTFTLANRYKGDMVVNHLDAYRIEQFGDAEDLAIPELLEDGVTLVEWGNNILPVLPPDRLEVRILLADDDDERRIEFIAVGERWTSRLTELSRRLVPWEATC